MITSNGFPDSPCVIQNAATVAQNELSKLNWHENEFAPFLCSQEPTLTRVSMREEV